MTELDSQLEETRSFIAKRSGGIEPAVAFVLGSGLSGFIKEVEVKAEIPYRQIPHFGVSSIEGHPGKLALGLLFGVPVALLCGRLHAYEGFSQQQVVYPVRAVSRLGARVLVVTNAAGALKKTMRAGDLMVIRDHINLTGENPLRGPNWAAGPRFVDMTDPYDPGLIRKLRACMKEAKVRHHQGVYVGVMGPSYETASEIRFFGRIGGGAVGMSTVAEVIAARHAGLRVAGVSCITNLGTGLQKTKLTHEEVKEAARKAEGGFARVLGAFTRRMKTEL